MSRPSISACLITQDRAPLLPRLLANVAPAVDEIVALDGGSKDESPSILRAHPKVRFAERRFDDIASQKNHAISLARSDWVLMIDTDELLADSLKAALPSLVKACRARWFKFPRYWIAAMDPPRYVRAEGLYPDHCLRLFRNEPFWRYEPSRTLHEHFPREGRGPGKKLRGEGHIFHLDFLLNDRAARERKVRRYNEIRPDLVGVNEMYLYEDRPHEIKVCEEPWPAER